MYVVTGENNYNSNGSISTAISVTLEDAIWQWSERTDMRQAIADFNSYNPIVYKATQIPVTATVTVSYDIRDTTPANTP